MSVGHRESLREYHDVDLNLDGKGGWSLKPIRKSEWGEIVKRHDE